MTESTKENTSLALKFHQSGDFLKAEEIYNNILQLEPDNANVLNLYGLLKLQTQKFDDAIKLIKQAAKTAPCAYYYENLGRAYLEKKDYEKAITSFNQSLEYNPNEFDVLFNLGLAYKLNMEFDKAIETYLKASELKPNDTSIYFNIANAYENKNKTATALKYYEKVLDINPQDADTYYFIAVLRLKLKIFKEGLEYYEVRPCKDFAILTQEKLYKDKINNTPMWAGESLDNKTLYIYYEAGFGDTIMYARYLPVIKEKWPTCKILFRPQSSLAAVFIESGFDAEIFDLHTPEEKVVFDYHTPIMSIPYILKHYEEKDIPYPEGYIKANPVKVQEYKDKFFNNENFKIGIKWQGNPAYDTCRIIPIEKFFKLFELENTKFYSLQKDDGAEELKKMPKGFELTDLGATFNDFSDTAAAIENLDLVICNDTSVAHMVLAMGKPCWVMLPFVPNWRWHMDYTYSPWYKSAKLFKQIWHGNWDEAFERAYEELKTLLENKNRG